MKNSCLFAFIGMLLWCGFLSPAACVAEPAGPAAAQTIHTQEVKDAAAAEERKVSLSDIEKSRALTGDRIYGLALFWVLIVLAVFLIRYQVRDDEKLYREGYYRKDLEQP
jgi:hypothetical protein